MANAEHLKILRNGVDIWNAWRDEHPECTPDFSGANLEGLNLRDANLHSANIRDSSLDFADLTNADLSEADLTYSPIRVLKTRILPMLISSAPNSFKRFSGAQTSRMQI